MAARLATIRVAELPSDRKQDYAAFARVVTADARQLLALEIGKPIASSALGDLKADELNRSGFAALQAGNYAEAITLLKRVVEREPKDKTAWNNLGWSYTALRQYEPAIEAFRKQIEINPYDQDGTPTWDTHTLEQQKDAEAEAAFQKQIEVNPLDRYATASLGSLYLERRQDRVGSVAVSESDYDAAGRRLVAGAARKSTPELEAGGRGRGRLRPGRGTVTHADHVERHRLRVCIEGCPSGSGAAVRRVRRVCPRPACIGATWTSTRRSDDKALDVVRSLGAYWDTLGWGVFRARRRRSRGAAGGGARGRPISTRRLR